MKNFQTSIRNVLNIIISLNVHAYTYDPKIRSISRVLITTYFYICEKVNEMLEVSSETMRLHVMVSGSGVGPSCTITPDDTFNVIQTMHKHSHKSLIFRVIIVGSHASISLSL